MNVSVHMIDAWEKKQAGLSFCEDNLGKSTQRSKGKTVVKLKI